MLELQRFLFRREAPSAPGMIYEILDPDTEERTGVIRQSHPAISGLVPRLFSFLVAPIRLDICETDDEPLVFSVTSSLGVFGREIQVFDAEENLVGYLRPGLRSAGGEVWIYDRNGFVFARLNGFWQMRHFSITRPDHSNLASVTAEVRAGSRAAPEMFIVAIDEQLAEEPFAKMLILGTVLGLDVLYYPRARGNEPC